MNKEFELPGQIKSPTSSSTCQRRESSDGNSDNLVKEDSSSRGGACFETSKKGFKWPENNLLLYQLPQMATELKDDGNKIEEDGIKNYASNNKLLWENNSDEERDGIDQNKNDGYLQREYSFDHM